jgi:hypothetical protein
MSYGGLMFNYAIRNMEDATILLKFTDNTYKEIEPGKCYFHSSPVEANYILQKIVDSFDVDVYEICIDTSEEEFVALGFSWLKEGF